MNSHVTEKNISFGKNETVLSLMQLSHINALATNIYVSLISSATVHFLDITQGEFQLIDILKKVRPIFFLCCSIDMGKTMKRLLTLKQRSPRVYLQK